MNILNKKIIFLFISIIIYNRTNICYSQTIDTTRVLEIAIIDFLYAAEDIQESAKLEKTVIIPGIDRMLNVIGITDYRFKVKRVTNGHLSYFIRKAIETAVTSLNYDIVVWGQVIPYDALKSYRLELMIFTNPNKFGRCVNYYVFEISNGRIIYWNNKNVDLPESTYTLIPSYLCCKLIDYLNNKSNTPSKNLIKKFKNKLDDSIKELLLADPAWIGWYPFQKYDNNQLYGFIEIIFKDGDKIAFPLHHYFYESLTRNIESNLSYNWQIEKIDLKKEEETKILNNFFVSEYDTIFVISKEDKIELKGKLLELQASKKKSEDLKESIIYLENEYNNIYLEYRDSYNLNFRLTFKNDSLKNYINSIKYLIKQINHQIAFLSSCADSIKTAKNELQKTIEEIEYDISKLKEIKGKLKKELNIFELLPKERLIASREFFNEAWVPKIQRYISFGNRIMDVVNNKSSTSVAYEKKVIDLDTSNVVKTIKKNESEIIALVNIDIFLTNRFNRRLEEYSHKIKQEISDLDSDKNILKNINKSLEDSVLLLSKESDQWSILHDSSKNELEKSKTDLENLTVKYNELIDLYSEKYKEHFDLIEEIRKLYFQRLQEKIKNEIYPRNDNN